MIESNMIEFKCKKKKNYSVNSLSRKKVSAIIINTIMEIIIENDSKIIIQKSNNFLKLNNNTDNECFKLLNCPSLSLDIYLIQIVSIIKPDVSTIIIAFIYIDKYWNLNRLLPDKSSLYLLISSSLYLAYSYNEDKKISFGYFSETVKISKYKFADVIYSLVKMLNYKLFVSETEYKQYEYCLIDKYNETYIK